MHAQQGIPTARDVEVEQEDSVEDKRIARLQAFADALKEKRKEAVEAKSGEGIETEWTEDEEYYDGIDDVNRAIVQKGATLNAPLTTAQPVAVETKSTVFMNITQTYVDMGAAAIADMLLPTDDMPFGVLPTPEPDLHKVAIANDPSMINGPGGAQIAAGVAAAKMIEEAKESADKAEKRIWDWLTESQWHSEVRALIDEAAKIGTSVLKGPFPSQIKRKRVKRTKVGQRTIAEIVIESKLSPKSKQISPRNLFPDPACGESIHNGSYVWERDQITAKQLAQMREQMDPDGEPFYIQSQIDKVLEEGPEREFENQTGTFDWSANPGKRFTIWYFYGIATAEDMEAAGCKCDSSTSIPVLVTMVNDRVIKAARSPLDSGEFPYDVFVWQKRPGKWYGKGEGRKLRTVQTIFNGATRAMMDNGGLSSKPQVVIDAEVIQPMDGVWSLTPGKMWRRVQGAPATDDIKKAITTINIESMQAELMEIVKFAIEMADRVATMPIQQQGQQGVTQETAEGRRLLQNNASVNKRRVAKIFDDRITEPHIQRYYEWILIYGEDDSMKRDLVIDARGSTALFERDAANIAVAQMAAYVKDPAFEIDPAKWSVEMLKSNKLDPKRFQFSEEQKAEMKRNPPVPPKAPQVEVAEINKTAKLEAASLDRDRDTEHFRVQHQIAVDRAKHDERKLELETNLAMLKYANDRKITLDKVKADLAKAAMTLRTQVELAHDERADPAAEVAKPKVEPKGRAPRGQAFQK